MTSAVFLPALSAEVVQFPGDAVWTILIAYLALLVGVGAGMLRLVVGVARRRKGEPSAFRAPRRILNGLLLLSGVLVLLPLFELAPRHFGAWKLVRDALRTQSAEIRTIASPDGVLEPTQSGRVTAALDLANRELAARPSTRNVSLLLYRDSYPYLAVRFEGVDGGVAVFDPATMYCSIAY
jgi:hypothetical protein